MKIDFDEFEFEEYDLTIGTKLILKEDSL